MQCNEVAKKRPIPVQTNLTSRTCNKNMQNHIKAKQGVQRLCRRFNNEVNCILLNTNRADISINLSTAAKFSIATGYKTNFNEKPVQLNVTLRYMN